MENGKLNKNYLILGGLAFATIIAFLLINYFSGPAKANFSDSPSAQQLNTEIRELESNVLELELIFEQKEMEITDIKRLLEEKYDQIALYEERIGELEKNGEVNAATIKALRDKISAVQNQIKVEQYKIEINELVADNADLTQMVDSIRLVLDVRDSAMLALNLNLEDCQNSRSGGTTATIPTPVEKPRFAIMEARKFRYVTLNKKEQEDGTFTSRTLKVKPGQNVKVCFELAGNELVESGNKRLHLILEDKNKKTYMNVKRGSVTFNFNGVEKVSSRTASAKYVQGSVQSVCMDFILPKGEQYIYGENKVFVIHENKVIGEHTLQIFPR